MSALCQVAVHRIVWVQPMTAMQAAAAATRLVIRWRLWAAFDCGPLALDLNGFRDCQGILKFDTEVSYRTVHLSVAEKELNGT